MKGELKVKLEMAKFLQGTLDEMAPQAKGRSSETAKEFAEFFSKVQFQFGFEMLINLDHPLTSVFSTRFEIPARK
jgi:hypothetical protein